MNHWVWLCFAGLFFSEFATGLTIVAPSSEGAEEALEKYHSGQLEEKLRAWKDSGWDDEHWPSIPIDFFIRSREPESLEIIALWRKYSAKPINVESGFLGFLAERYQMHRGDRPQVVRIFVDELVAITDRGELEKLDSGESFMVLREAVIRHYGLSSLEEMIDKPIDVVSMGYPDGPYEYRRDDPNQPLFPRIQEFVVTVVLGCLFFCILAVLAMVIMNRSIPKA